MRNTRWAPLVCALGLWGCGTPSPGVTEGTFHIGNYVPPSSGLAGYQQATGSNTPVWAGTTDTGRHDWNIGPQQTSSSWGSPSWGSPSWGSPSGGQPSWGSTSHGGFGSSFGAFPSGAGFGGFGSFGGFGPYAPPFYAPFYAPLVNLSPVFPADLYAPPIVPFAAPFPAFGQGPFW